MIAYNFAFSDSSREHAMDNENLPEQKSALAQRVDKLTEEILRTYPKVEMVCLAQNHEGCYYGLRGQASRLVQMCRTAIADILARVAAAQEKTEPKAADEKPAGLPLQHMDGICQLWHNRATDEYVWLAVWPKEPSDPANFFREVGPRFKDAAAAIAWGAVNLNEEPEER
jgi:hypothetical protein